MKNLKKYVGVLMLLTLLVGFTSCEDDETIFDHIVGPVSYTHLTLPTIA